MLLINIQKQKLYNNIYKYPYLFKKFYDKDDDENFTYNPRVSIEYIESLAPNSSYLINCLKLNDKTTTYIYNKMVLNRVMTTILNKIVSNYFCSDIKNYIMDFIYTDLDRF